MNNLAAAPSRLGYLDGLRGIAALVVVERHFFNIFINVLEPNGGLIARIFEQPPFWILINGNFAVYVFFVLSGFVLAESASKARAGFISQVVTRYFRLTCPMALSLIFAWFLLNLFPGALSQFLDHYPDDDGWLQSDFYCSDVPGIGKAITDGFYGAYRHGASNFNMAVWTMQKELIGSICIYAIYCLVPSRHVGKALIVFAFLAIPRPIYLAFPMGAGLREVWSRGGLKDSPWSWAALALGLTAASLEGTFVFPLLEPTRIWCRSFDLMYAAFHAAGAAFILLAILRSTFLQYILSTAIPRFLGRISFSLYLVHLPILSYVFTWVAVRLLGIDRFLVVGSIWVASMSISLLAAWLMTVVFDEPLVSGLRAIKKIRFRTLLSFGKS